MSYVLESNNLSKRFGNKLALKDFTLKLEYGKILGLLGPNGSGKTTLIKIIAGLLKSYEGEILICENRPSVITKEYVSYLPDRNPLEKNMSIRDCINLYRDFYKDFDLVKMEELLEFMELNESMKVGSLSKGMVEKLNLSLVLSRKARLYILDEPLGGVDLITRDKILDAIINNYCEESSMIITTHIVSDVERIFDEVAFINDGSLIEYGDCEELRAKYKKSIEEIYKVVLESR